MSGDNVLLTFNTQNILIWPSGWSASFILTVYLDQEQQQQQQNQKARMQKWIVSIIPKNL